MRVFKLAERTNQQMSSRLPSDKGALRAVKTATMEGGLCSSLPKDLIPQSPTGWNANIVESSGLVTKKWAEKRGPETLTSKKNSLHLTRKSGRGSRSIWRAPTRAANSEGRERRR